MKQDIKTRWVEALRSGRYMQGTGWLRKFAPEGDDTYCCLGVLCELAVEAGEIPAPHLENSRYYYGDEAMTLPYRVLKWAGLNIVNDIPQVQITTEEHNMIEEDWKGGVTAALWASLAFLNDHGLDFDAIATIIEREM